MSSTLIANLVTSNCSNSSNYNLISLGPHSTKAEINRKKHKAWPQIQSYPTLLLLPMKTSSHTMRFSTSAESAFAEKESAARPWTMRSSGQQPSHLVRWDMRCWNYGLLGTKTKLNWRPSGSRSILAHANSIPTAGTLESSCNSILRGFLVLRFSASWLPLRGCFVDTSRTDCFFADERTGEMKKRRLPSPPGNTRIVKFILLLPQSRLLCADIYLRPALQMCLSSSQAGLR